jgi:hypothetical protein
MLSKSLMGHSHEKSLSNKHIRGCLKPQIRTADIFQDCAVFKVLVGDLVLSGSKLGLSKPIRL